MGRSAASVLKRNHVTVSGDPAKPALLFAHGFGCDQGMWRLVSPAFAADHFIVLLDYVGSGHSEAAAYNPERYSDLNGYAQDIIEIGDALGVKQIRFVGHSVSGMIGVLAAIKRPDLISDLLLVGPSPSYISDPPDYVTTFTRQDIVELLALMDQNFAGWAAFLGPQVMQNPERPELAAELTSSFCRSDPAITRQFAKVTFLSDNRADLPKVPVPALILQCADDLIAPLTVGEYLHRRLPTSHLHVLKATGHCPHLSHPEEVIGAIRAYLARRYRAH